MRVLRRFKSSTWQRTCAFLFLRNNYFENGNKTKKDETIKCYFSLSLGCSRFLSFLRIGLVRECVLPQLFSPTVTAMTSARRRPIGAGCFRCVNTKRRRILMPRTARPSVVVIFFLPQFCEPTLVTFIGPVLARSGADDRCP